MSPKLKGMTWSHPRGYEPMVATSRIWQDRTGVEIGWDKRSLQDFESFPVEELAREYDLIVIDHPHVGQITKENCLTPLDVSGREDERDDLAKNSIGGSYESYGWQDHQWAFPIDAAAQVQAYRPDAVDAPVSRWSETVEYARQGRVTLPLRPPHSLMCFFTLAANLGTPCSHEKGPLIAREAGRAVLDLLFELAALLDPADFSRDPIASSEAMAADGPRAPVLMPLGYGYVNYGMAGFRQHRLAFADIPAAGDNGSVGSALGGTGIAVSAFSEHIPQALDYAYWVASGQVQASLFAAAGGQPGHGRAWDDPAVNAATGDFYRNTRRTLDGAWMRPRHNGYMDFQQKGSERLTQGLQTRDRPDALLDDLDRLFEESF